MFQHTRSPRRTGCLLPGRLNDLPRLLPAPRAFRGVTLPALTFLVRVGQGWSGRSACPRLLQSHRGTLGVRGIRTGLPPASKR